MPLLHQFGDGVVNIIHKVIVNQDTSILRIDKVLGWGDFLKIAGIGLLAIGAIIVAWKIIGVKALVTVLVKCAGLSLVVGIPTMMVAGGVLVDAVKYTISSFTDTEISIPVYNISPEEIFENDIPMFNVNFFDRQQLQKGSIIRNKLENGEELNTGEQLSEENSRAVLTSVISEWYYRLLMIAVVGMMSVLVYIGIRIILSARSSDKAKYKQMLGDWLVGIVLMFTMHYIMSFSNLFVDKLTDVIRTSRNKSLCMVQIDLETEGLKNKIIDQLKEKYEVKDLSKADESDGSNVIYTTDNEKTLVIFTNLMGKLRFQLQYEKESTESFIGYTILFIIPNIFSI